MSSRTDAAFGALADRVDATTPSAQPRTPWCFVDGVLPGVIAQWTNLGGEWEALVAYVKDGELRTATLPARRLTPR
ncbi:hypothetical protein [Propioniciclava soli]|uniref:Uncharacterized protein n=1 Tax=Propioniciclava soli TaxID=2775081 RepID=A0ABZ3CBD8_9ACTN|nr:hypothetical protein [Propioniciclava soli]